MSTVFLPATKRRRRRTALPKLESIVDKKAKKKLETTRQKIQKLQQQLAGAKSQDDEPGEVERLEAEIAQLKKIADELKAS